MLNVNEFDAMLISGGRVIDPVNGRDEVCNVAIVNGRIAEQAPPSATVIDATGWIVCPGLMDMHVHLREPGQSQKETIATGTAAAAAGGFTYVACMPNTDPPIDHPDTVRQVLDQACRADWCEVGPVAAITRGRAGRELCDLAAMQQAGAVAFSDDGTGVEDDTLMRAAFEQAREIDAVLIQHCEYQSISAGGVMHLGETSRKLGLPGLDPRSEEAMIERDITLVGETGGRYHVAHISTARAVDLVRQAKDRELPVTAEVCPHHLLLTDQACDGGNANTKMHPPLRTHADVEACRSGLMDGTIDCVVTDHAPHTEQEKSVGFLKAPPGIVGTETAVSLTARAMIETGLADWPKLVEWFMIGPARVLSRACQRIEADTPARLTFIDPHARWIVDPETFQTMGRNTPFAGWELTGRPVAIARGRRIISTGEPISRRSVPR